MTGTTLTITVADEAIQEKLQALIRAGEALSPVFEKIGETLTESTKARFTSKTAPDGTPWKPTQNNPDILVLSGQLESQIGFQYDEQGMEVGSNKIYAATHQFGRDEQNIDARPFLGISEADEAEILAIFAEHLGSE